MPLRQMQVLGGGLQVAVPEQNLDGAQVGARLQQVSRPTVAQRVRGDALADAGALRGIATCNPDGFVRNGLIESGLTGAGGEQIESGLPPAPVLTQGFQQGWTQRQITILAALAFHHADDHPLAIDIADFETSQFAASHAGGVERHQQSSSKQGSRRIDQSRNFLPDRMIIRWLSISLTLRRASSLRRMPVA